MVVYILSQLHAVPLKVAVFKNNQTFLYRKLWCCQPKARWTYLTRKSVILDIQSKYSLKHCQAWVFPQTQALYSLWFVLIASCFLLNQKISSYLKLSSYPCDPVLSKPANVILNCPYCGHNVSHTQIEILLPWGVGRFFKQNLMAD